MIKLTAKEKALLPKAVEYCKKIVDSTGKLPPQEELRREFSTRWTSANALHKYIKAKNLVEVPEKIETKTTNVIKDDTWSISIPRTPIHTLEELVAHCQIDLSIWEVESWEANKWEMAYIANVQREELVEPETDEEIEGNEKAPAKKSKKPQIKTVKIDKEAGVQPLFQVKAKLRRKKFETLTEYAKDNARLTSLNAKLKIQLAKANDITKHLAVNHAGYDDLLDNFREFASLFGDLQLPKTNFAQHEPLVVPAVRDGHSEDAVLLLSDTHYGDRIRREDTSGFPEFDLTIAGNRTGFIAKKTKQVLTLHRAMYPIKRLVVWIGGDIGNGDLHDAPQSNELFLPAQVHFSYHMLKFVIEDLLELTVPDEKGNSVIEEITLLFTVGNHMRMDEKMPTKLQAQRTLDWLIYQWLIERFTGVPKVTIRQEMSPYIFESIRGHRHLFAHGMQVGYKNSPDAQCKSMGAFINNVRALFDSPEWRRKHGLRGETFARACIGDIHVPVSFPRLLSNGSLNGQNELGVNWMLEPIPAGQQLFGVADKHMETWKYFLECSHIQKEKGDYNAYGEFARDYKEQFSR